jgi:hypothetical protein
MKSVIVAVLLMPAIALAQTPSEVAEARAAVLMKLKDPESARWGAEYYGSIPPNKSIVICGAVNSKNSYGGYVGRVPYVYFQKIKKLYIGDDPPASPEMFKIRCEK